MTRNEPQLLCDYCSLPLPPGGAAVGRIDAPRYCCLGCSIAAAISGEKSEQGQAQAMLARLGLAIFLSMNVMALTMALWSQEWNGELSAKAQATFDLLRYGSALFSLPVLMLLGGPLFTSAWKDALRLRLSTDQLIAAGVLAAYAYSLVSLLRGQGHVYFEVGCMVLTTMTLGRYLEATGKLKTTEALRELEKLLPPVVRITVAENDRLVSSSEAQAGDLLHVLPGERIAVDGWIERNIATIDEQVVTGESQPVVKEPGDRVYSGSLNFDGDLYIRAAAPCDAGALQSMINAVIAAASGNAHYRRLADKITRLFLPAVFLIAAGTLAYHWHFAGLAAGLMTALAVVLIACPCALGLATPMALWSALGSASRQGVLFRDGDVLSRLAEVDLVCFDKTGTLTSGKPVLMDRYQAPFASDDEVLAAASAMAGATSHPLALALQQALPASPLKMDAENAQTKAGRGVAAELPSLGTTYLGSLRYLEGAGLDTQVDLRSCCGNELQTAAISPQFLKTHASQAMVALGWKGRLQALFLFEESLRSGVQSTILALKQNHLAVHMLTGDRRERAEAIAEQLGIEAIAELLPDEKLACILRWKSAGRNVLMIGDGLNDGPALTAADVGVALGCGADLTREVADVCLLGNELSLLPKILQLSRHTVNTIRWNLLWAFGYNSIGVCLATSGLLHPILAAAAMVGSSVLVVTNSLRLAQPEAAEQLLPRTSTQPSEALLEKQDAMVEKPFRKMLSGSTP